MKSYKKGATFERELIKLFREKGFVAVRSAGSGKMRGPDLVAVKGGRLIVIEAKHRKDSILSLTKDQFNVLKEWEDKAFAEVYVVWKKHKHYFFIPLRSFKFRGSSFSISWDEAKVVGKRKEEVIF